MNETGKIESLKGVGLTPSVQDEPLLRRAARRVEKLFEKTPAQRVRALIKEAKLDEARGIANLHIQNMPRKVIWRLAHAFAGRALGEMSPLSDEGRARIYTDADAAAQLFADIGDREALQSLAFGVNDKDIVGRSYEARANELHARSLSLRTPTPQ